MKNKKILSGVLIVGLFVAGIVISATYYQMTDQNNKINTQQTETQKALRQEMLDRLSSNDVVFNAIMQENQLAFNDMMADFPFDEYLTTFEQQLDKVFAQARHEFDKQNTPGNVQSTSFMVEDTPSSFEVSAIIKNVKKEDLKVQIHKGYLSVTVETENKEVKKDEKSQTPMAQSLQQSQFKKVFRLPSNVDISKAEVNFANDVLNIKMPKTELKDDQPITLQVK